MTIIIKFTQFPGHCHHRRPSKSTTRTRWLIISRRTNIFSKLHKPTPTRASININYIHRNLQLLNLSSANIDSWTDIDRLSKFPSLKNLRVQNWPLWSKCDSTEHERRQFVIARLPHVEILNGGGRIGSEEREDAERAFIRYYQVRPESDRPARYAELLARHGKLDPLVKIDLRPEKKWEKFIFVVSLTLHNFVFRFSEFKSNSHSRSAARFDTLMSTGKKIRHHSDP